MKQIFYLTLIMVLTSSIAMGQVHGTSYHKPFWVNGHFSDLDNSYIEVVSGSAYNFDEARRNALSEIMKRRSLATGSQANVTINGKDVNVTSGHDVIVKARVIDEYTDTRSGGYTVYMLVQTAKNPTYTFENVSMTNKYSFSARSFIPGMQQLYKGSVAKGSCFIAGEVLSIGAIIVCENMRTSYVKKSKEQPKFVREYSDKAKSWETGRNIAIGAAACIYAYNIIDAAVAKGKMRLTVNKANGSGLSIMPYASPYSTGIYMGFTF